MPNSKDSHSGVVPNAELKDERLIRQAMISLGWILPQTPQEVALIELEDEGTVEDLPESLRDPLRILDTKRKEWLVSPILPLDQCVVKGLHAMAARNGKQIPDEIRRQMDNDRKHAEEDHTDGKE